MLKACLVHGRIVPSVPRTVSAEAHIALRSQACGLLFREGRPSAFHSQSAETLCGLLDGHVRTDCALDTYGSGSAGSAHLIEGLLCKTCDPTLFGLRIS